MEQSEKLDTNCRQTETLKACPKCRKENSFLLFKTDYPLYPWRIQCRSCYYELSAFGTREFAIEAWNSEWRPWERIAELEAVIERDRTQFAEVVGRLKGVVRNYLWLTEGRGSYEWDDDRYRVEFYKAAHAWLEEVRVLEKLAQDLKDSPKTTEAVHAARVDKDKRIAELENALAELRNLK